MVPSITESAIDTAIGNMLQAMLPQFAAGQIIVGQTNQTPWIKTGSFIDLRNIWSAL